MSEKLIKKKIHYQFNQKKGSLSALTKKKKNTEHVQPNSIQNDGASLTEQVHTHIKHKLQTSYKHHFLLRLLVFILMSASWLQVCAIRSSCSSSSCLACREKDRSAQSFY